MRLIKADEMQAIDQQAIGQIGIPGVVLMENAGRAATDVFCREFFEHYPGPVLVLAGKGNNGGDGYVMARILADRGWQVTVLVLGSEEQIIGDAAVMLDILHQLELPVAFIEGARELRSHFAAAEPELLIDALFGTGLTSEIRGLPGEAIAILNSAGVPVCSVDIPSGVDGSTGRICGSAVRADLTITFDHAKVGHGCNPGAACAGRLEVVEIGIPRSARPEPVSDVRLVDAAEAALLLPERLEAGHKGSFGHLLLLAGSVGKTGAAVLASQSAVRSGCGLVTAATAAAVHDILEVKLTEAMTCPLADSDGRIALQAREQIAALLVSRQALAIGPGLGMSEGLAELIGWLVAERGLPTVIDADGLNLLAGQMDRLQQRCGDLPILTPHPGEMARLSGLSVAEIESNRYRVACDFAAEHQVVLLLKGVRTIIAAPDGRVRINTSGNNGLASGGSGDVLTGLIGGLLAQGLDPFDAAVLAAWLHGRAAELVADGQGTAGMAASDLLRKLPMARRELMKGVCAC